MQLPRQRARPQTQLLRVRAQMQLLRGECKCSSPDSEHDRRHNTLDHEHRRSSLNNERGHRCSSPDSECNSKREHSKACGHVLTQGTASRPTNTKPQALASQLDEQPQRLMGPGAYVCVSLQRRMARGKARRAHAPQKCNTHIKHPKARVFHAKTQARKGCIMV